MKIQKIYQELLQAIASNKPFSVTNEKDNLTYIFYPAHIIAVQYYHDKPCIRIFYTTMYFDIIVNKADQVIVSRTTLEFTGY